MHNLFNFSHFACGCCRIGYVITVEGQLTFLIRERGRLLTSLKALT